MTEKSFQTKSIREGHEPTNEQEHSAAIFLTSSYKFNSAEEAAKRFDKKEEGNVYSRFTNPTVDAFQNKLAALEGAEKCQATASGMSAIFATIMTILKPGEHMVASRCMFGTTIVLLNDIIEKSSFKNRKINFLNIDTEKTELDVLKSLNFKKYQPELICVEIHHRGSSPKNKFELIKHPVYLFLKKRHYKIVWKKEYSIIFSYLGKKFH